MGILSPLEVCTCILLALAMMAGLANAQSSGSVNGRHKGGGIADSTRSYRVQRAAASSPASIIGAIRTRDGIELNGARVALFGEDVGAMPLRQVVSKRDGWFAIINIPPGKYRLQVALQGYESFSQAHTLLKAGDIVIVERHLTPVSEMQW